MAIKLETQPSFTNLKRLAYDTWLIDYDNREETLEGKYLTTYQLL
jgi:hypothetical protein